MFLLPSLVQAQSTSPSELSPVWTVFEPLGLSRSADSAPAAERFGSLIERGLFHRRTDTELNRFFERYTEGFSNLNLSSLYHNEKIDWETTEGDAKRIRYRGEPEPGLFRFTTSGVTEPLRKTGASTTQITIESRENAFLLSTFRRVKTGSLDEKTTMDILRRINEYLDFNRHEVDYDTPGELLSRYRRRIRRDVPELSRYLRQFVDFETLGHPGSDTEPSDVEITYTVDGRTFAQQYPEFYRVYDETLLPSGLDITVSDSKGRELFRYTREGPRVSWSFYTQEGRIVPYADTGPIDTEGYSPAELRRMELHSSTTSWITMFGLTFGMNDMRFRSHYDSGRVTWRLSEAPQLNLPWGVRLLLSPFISPFLNHLETGNNGEGLVYRESFRRSDGTTYRIEKLALPLRDSPIIPFVLKLYNLAWSPLDEAALEDLRKFGRTVSDRIRSDYRSFVRKNREEK